MSVLVVSPRYAPDPGGIERLLAQLLPALRAEGLDVVVATGTTRGQATAEVVDGVPVYRFPFTQAIQSGQPAEILSVANSLRDVELAHGVDARHIHGFGDLGLWFASREHRRRPYPLAVSVHGTVDGLGPIGLTATGLLRSAHVVSAVSEAVQQSVVTAVPSCAGRVRLIRNGLRPPAVAPPPWRRGHLLTVGRLEDQKGFDVAVDAVGLLRARHADVDLIIVGDGRRRGDLRARARRAGVEDRIHLVGRLSPAGVSAAMGAASIVLVPSRTTEGFSLVALEAAHAARPVVAAGVGGLAETIQDGVTGLIVPPDDPAALAVAIDRLLDDPVLACTMGLTARDRAVADFGLGPCLSAYRTLYDELSNVRMPERMVGAERRRA